MLVIFGASGDLARRKLLPAIYNLAHEGALPERMELVGISRGELTDDEFRREAREAIERFSRRRPDEDVLTGLLSNVRYVRGSFDDDDLYERLRIVLDSFDADVGEPLNRVFYLSTAPEFFSVITGRLGEAGLNRAEDAEVRAVIEKPIGYDLASARALNDEVLSYFDEQQVFRIDHYLGKETVQNLMALRFANALFEPVWNRNFIDNVQITAAEDIGIGSRAGYYDHAGALRDLVQNHMLQLLALLTMEPPTAFDAHHVRDEKVKVLDAVIPPLVEEVPSMAVRGRYGRGVVGGVESPAYLEEPGVDPHSRTETYAALRLHVSNWRWAGVPFYLRTGKRLARKLTEIAVTLRPVPHVAFQSTGSVGVQANQIILTVQPDEGVSVSLGREDPGYPNADPSGEHGVSLRDLVPVGIAGGLRAPDPRRDARRRDAIHPQRRGRGAVGDHRPDPDLLARRHRFADSRVPGGIGRPDRSQRAAGRRTRLAPTVGDRRSGEDRGRGGSLGRAEHDS